MMIPCGSYNLTPDQVLWLTPILKAHVASSDECDPPIDLDQLPIPATASPALRACLNVAYFDFLVCVANAPTCTEKHACRKEYEETTVPGCYDLHGD